MTAVAIATRRRLVPVELEREILVRVDRAALHVCEPELRYKLSVTEAKQAQRQPFGEYEGSSAVPVGPRSVVLLVHSGSHGRPERGARVRSGPAARSLAGRRRPS
jgi:hypothetical protein